MTWPFLRVALRLDGAPRMWWGALPGGFDGWTSDRSSAFVWAFDAEYLDARHNHLPGSFSDLHGRVHYIDPPANGRACDARWESKDGEVSARLVPWEDEP